MAGFLPPIDSTGYQLGWVEYDIEPNKNLPDGAVISNQAWVNFDGVGPTNPAPKEAPWSNMIDNTPPESYLQAYPDTLVSDSVLVSWQGFDEGSGIKSYTIYESENNVDYSPWIVNYTGESKYFFGEKGKTYYFYSIAKDNVGLNENSKSDFEAMVSFISTEVEELIAGRGEFDVLIYPNPTECCFKVFSNLSYNAIKSIEVTNTLGEIILQKQYAQNEITIDLSNYAKGIYYIKVECEHNLVVKKIITY